MKYTGGNYIQETVFKRDPDSHKGDFGRMLIFAGSTGMAGAAVLCAKGAVRSGAGLVRFLLPSFSEPVFPVFQACVPEASCVEYEPGMRFDEYEAIAAGPGLGAGTERRKILCAMIESYKGVLVLDADALNMISEGNELEEMVRTSEAKIIITPHPGEAKRLLNVRPGEMFSVSHPQAREDVARSLVEKFNCITVLKGSHTIVAQKRNDYIEMYENTTGNAGMASGGSGDVLTGVIASLAGQKYQPMDAARIGVYIHGLAGDLAAADKGQMGMSAMDTAENIAYALKAYYN